MSKICRNAFNYYKLFHSSVPSLISRFKGIRAPCDNVRGVPNATRKLRRKILLAPCLFTQQNFLPKVIKIPGNNGSKMGNNGIRHKIGVDNGGASDIGACNNFFNVSARFSF